MPDAALCAGQDCLSVFRDDEASPPALASQRDSFLDLLRAVSICRVVLLHTLLRPPVVYLPWVMWIYPGMPEVFFVSGAVTAQMLSRRPARQVIALKVSYQSFA